MADYEHLLLAVDLTEDSISVADRAQTLVAAFGSRLSVIHVIEPLSLTYGGDIPIDLSSIQAQIQEQAREQLTEFAGRLNIAPEAQHLIFGRPESEIHRVAKCQSVDLIVVGSHGRHGLALLLGSVANSILHGATCDVLAVRVGQTGD